MDYRELKFYQRAREVVRGVDAEIKIWPRSIQAQEISRQLFRAAISVGANIAEGHGRHNGLEYIHYLMISQGSANEVNHWLNTSRDCGIGSPENLQRLVLLNDETRKMLTATINSLKARQPAKSVHEDSSPYSPIPFSQESNEDEL